MRLENYNKLESAIYAFFEGQKMAPLFFTANAVEIKDFLLFYPQ